MKPGKTGARKTGTGNLANEKEVDYYSALNTIVTCTWASPSLSVKVLLRTPP
jgi:hypothetical protein